MLSIIAGSSFSYSSRVQELFLERAILHAYARHPIIQPPLTAQASVSRACWRPYSKHLCWGPLIMEYIRDAVRKHNLSQHFQFQHKVISAEWSSETQKWQLLVVDGQGQTRQIVAGFLARGTENFDYSTLLSTDISGLNNFDGKIINPEFWPSKYNYDGQRITVIGVAPLLWP